MNFRYFIVAGFFLILGCGPRGGSLVSGNSMTNKLSTNSNAISSTSTSSSSSTSTSSCSGMSGVIVTPAAGMLGGTQTVHYNGRSYLVSAHSTDASKNFVYSVPAGASLPICFTGTFAKETGLFPNPTATFDVVVLQSISFSS